MPGQEFRLREGIPATCRQNCCELSAIVGIYRGDCGPGLLPGAGSATVKFLNDSGNMGAVWHAACLTTMITGKRAVTRPIGFLP